MDPLSIIGRIASITSLATQTVDLINITIEELGSRPATLLQLSSGTSLFCSVLGHVERSFEARGSTANQIYADLTLPISSFMEIVKNIGILLADLQPRQSPHSKATLSILWHNKMKEMAQLLDDLEKNKMTLLLALQSLQGEESFLFDKGQSAALIELQKAVEELKSWHVPDSAFQSDPKRWDTVTEAFPKAEQRPDNVPETSSFPQIGEASNLSQKDSIGYSMEGSEVLKNGKVCLVFCDLERPGSSGRFTGVVEAEPNECLYNIILRLFEAGYHRICGFQDFEQKEDVFPPIVPFDEPFQPAITAGDSCYNINSGLRINQHQSLIDYFNEFLRTNVLAELTPEPSLVHSDRIYLNDPSRQCEINVSFQRTLRIPEDGKAYPIPACFDSFQLLKVDEFVNKRPSDVMIRGGIFFPMFQREALAVTFDATAPKLFRKGKSDQALQDVKESFAVKLYAGSVNCISGKASGDCLADDQDYIVCPQQTRLDGFGTSAGEVKQFVAMPLIQEFGIEKQTTGPESIARLQLQVARRLSDDVEFESQFNAPDTKNATKLDLFQSPSQLGMAAGQILHMRDLTNLARGIKYDISEIKLQAEQLPQVITLSESKCRPTFVSDIIQRNSSESGNMRRFILRPVAPLKVFMDWDSMKIPRGNRWEEFSPFLDVSDFKKYLSSTMLNEQTALTTGYLCFNKTIHRGYPEEYTPIKDLELADGVIHFEAGRIPLLMIAGTVPSYVDSLKETAGHTLRRGSDNPKPVDDTAAGWEMRVGVGGKLKQHIYRTVDKRLWDWKNAYVLNVQILNSVAFHSATGLSPRSPITFKQYVDNAMPIYSFIPADAVTLEREGIDFRGIGEVQESQCSARTGRRINKKGAVGCANCEIKLCDKMLVPCKHIWCSDCIRSEMVQSGRITCLYCQVISEKAVQISAPVELPRAAAHPVHSLLESEPITLPNEELVEKDIRSLLVKLIRDLPYRFSVIKSPKDIDEAVKSIAGVANHIMIDGNEHEFYIIFARVKDAPHAVRILIVRAMLKFTQKAQFMEKWLNLVSSVEELGENGLRHLLEGDDYRSSGCLPAILDWTVALSLSFEDLGVSATSLLSVESAETLYYVISYLTLSGKSIPKDYGISVFDVLPTTRTSMKVTTVRNLDTQGCDMNALDGKGRNILFRSEDQDVFYGLMDIGVRADILDHTGNAPIHHAILDAQPSVLEALISHQSGRQTVNMCNGQGLTPYQLSLRSQVTILQDILIRSGADTDIPKSSKRFRDKLRKLW